MGGGRRGVAFRIDPRHDREGSVGPRGGGVVESLLVHVGAALLASLCRAREERRLETVDREELVEVTDTKRRLEKALSLLHEKRGDVNPKVFAKVEREYQEKMKGAEARLAELLPAVRRQADEIVVELGGGTTRRAAIDDARDELDLRHHIGEIGDDERAARVADLAREAADLESSGTYMMEQLRWLVDCTGNEGGLSAQAIELARSGSMVEPAVPAPKARTKSKAKPNTAPRTASPMPGTVVAELANLDADAAGDPFQEGPAPGRAAGKRTGGQQDTLHFTPPHLRVRTSQGEQLHFLDLGETSIGRGEDNDLIVNEHGVLPRHAVVRWQNNRFVVMSLAENDDAMLVNGAAIRQATLAYGDRVELGNAELFFQEPSGLGGSPTGSGAVPVSSQLPTVLTTRSQIEQAMASRGSAEESDTLMIANPTLLLRGPGGYRTVRVDFGETTIGAAQACDIVVAGKGVAARHATIAYRDRRHVLVSAPKAVTLVNDRKVTTAPLSDGDRIRIGATEIVYSAMKVADD